MNSSHSGRWAQRPFSELLADIHRISAWMKAQGTVTGIYDQYSDEGLIFMIKVLSNEQHS